MIKKLVKKAVTRCESIICCSLLFMMTSPVYADLPKPPDSVLPSGDKTHIDVGADLMFTALGYCLTIGGVVIVLAGGMGMLSAWNESKRKDDLNHFFKHAAVCLGVVTGGLALAYYGTTIIPG